MTVGDNGRGTGVFPASGAQKQFWLLDQTQRAGHAYNVPRCFRLRGSLDVHRLEESINAVVERHEILRTLLFTVDGELSQVILPFVRVPLSLKTAEHADLDDLVQQEIAQRFDLSTAPLMRVTLFQLAEDEHHLLFVWDHSVIDQHSIGLVLSEIGAIYSSVGTAEPGCLSTPACQYSDYSQWQAEWLSGEQAARQTAYWAKALRGSAATLELPFSKPRPARRSFLGTEFQFALTPDLSRRVKIAARESTVSLFTFLLSAFQTLLYRTTGEEHVVVGVPMTNRRNSDFKDVVGCFMNMLPVPIDACGQPSFSEFLKQTRKAMLGAHRNQEEPFQSIVLELNPSRDPSFNPLFQVSFLSDPPSVLQLKGIETEPIYTHNQSSKLDLTVNTWEHDSRIVFGIEYATDLFDRESISCLARSCEVLLQGIVDDPNCSIAALPLLADAEISRLVDDAIRTATAYDRETCVARMVEEQVSRSSDRTAVVCKDEAVTYADLNRRANQLARRIRALGGGPDERVAVCLDRSIDLVVTLLGVLKAEACYVPLDPAYPAERIAFMLEDSGARLAVTTQRYGDLVGSVTGIQSVFIDSERSELDRLDGSDLEITRDPSRLAYVIYTSGSTGKPKGVMIEHRALVNFLCSMQEEPGITEEDVVQTLTTVCFDIAGLEIFLPLISGARLVVAERTLAIDPARLVASIEENHATILQATPSSWRMLLDHGWQGTPKVKVLCGGEAMGSDLAERLIGTGCEVWNLYGPTETTIWSSASRVRSKADAAFVGQPIANTEFQILSPHLSHQPIGVPGELFIGGDGLARGYLGREELTREKFIEDPRDPDKRLYRTGDLVVRQADGAIEFLGRLDNQVKLRGFRIELGEIETLLHERDEVQDAVVIVREDVPGDQRLVAYLVTRNANQIEERVLREALRKRLPDYMLPATYVQLESLPMTPNGKIDRKSLPEPAQARIERPASHGADTATGLMEIWQELLGCSGFGPDDDFFDLGGHSLLAVEVVNSINSRLWSDLTIEEFFVDRTIARLVARLADGRSGVDPADTAGIDEPEAVGPRADLTAVAQAIGKHALSGVGRRPFRMRDSLICKWLLAPLFGIGGGSIRRAVQTIILKLEGGPMFTRTLRKLYLAHYGIEIGDYSGFCFDAGNFKPGTSFGRYCSVTPTARFETANHPSNTISTCGIFYQQAIGFSSGYAIPRNRIEIGHDVHIGHNVTIVHPTRRIGDGAIVAAGSLVAEDVPPYAVVAGYPAKVIRYRFSKDKIREIEESRWWEASLEHLEAIRDEFIRPVEGDRVR